jgi:hypothetical protein
MRTAAPNPIAAPVELPPRRPLHGRQRALRLPDAALRGGTGVVEQVATVRQADGAARLLLRRRRGLPRLCVHQRLECGLVDAPHVSASSSLRAEAQLVHLLHGQGRLAPQHGSTTYTIEPGGCASSQRIAASPSTPFARVCDGGGRSPRGQGTSSPPRRRSQTITGSFVN